MKIRLLIFCFGFLPALVFASVGDDINALLDQVFGDGEMVDSESSLVPTENTETTEPQATIENIPQTPQSAEIQQEIKQAERQLTNFENRIFELEQDLWANRKKRDVFQSDLQLLDSEMGFTSEKVNYLAEQEQKWKTDLENITRKKSDLKAEIRVLTREYIDFVSKKVVRDETFGSGESVSMLKWLFSDKSAAQIIEENRQARLHQEQQQYQIKKLKNMKAQLDMNERHAAILYSKIFHIKNQLLTEKQNLKTFANAKANLIAQLEYTEGQKSKALSDFKRQQKASAQMLASLREDLQTVQRLQTTVLEENDEIQLDFPLKIPMEITAQFHDPEYKTEFEIDHTGSDFFAPQGSEIYAPADGIVKKAEWNDYDYSFFVIQHGPDFYTVYGHISEILVAENQEVKRGDLVGRTGGTPGTAGAGYFTAGPHLHFEVYKEGEFQNPLFFIQSADDSQPSDLEETDSVSPKEDDEALPDEFTDPMQIL